MTKPKLKTVNWLFKSPYVSLFKTTYELPDGREKVYNVASRNQNYNPRFSLNDQSANAVTLFVLNKTMDKMLMTHEFRYPINGFVNSTPAGLIDEGESAFTAAVRELQEETGYFHVLKYAEMPATYSAIGLTDELVKPIVLVIDENHNNGTNLSSSEFISYEWIDKDTANNIALNINNKMSARAQLALMYFAKDGFKDLDYIVTHGE